MFLIRVLQRRDLDAILRLDLMTPEAPHWTRAAYERFLADRVGRLLLVAELGDEFVGFVAAEMAAGVCQLESIVIDESARRKGAGAALLSELFRWAATNEASRVELEVHAGNKTAIEFYEKYGFELDGLRRGYYRNPEGDAVLMSRALCS